MTTVARAKSLEQRLNFVGFDAAASARMEALAPTVLKHLGPALDRFYGIIRRTPDVARFFGNEEQMSRAQNAQSNHWQSIAAGRFDDNYAASSNAIGQRHARIGLEPSWYVGGYALIVETVVKGVMHDWMERQAPTARKRKPQELVADADVLGAHFADLFKAVMVDVDIAVTTYFEKLRADAEEKERKAAERQQRVIDAMGAAMAQLARGDVSVRIEDEFDGALNKLRDDFNFAIESIDKTISAIGSATDLIGSNAGAVAEAAQDISDRMTRQAAAIEQSVAALDGVTASINKTAEGTTAASGVALEADKAAVQGGSVVKGAVEAMGQIEQSSAKISRIISVIDEIAFQTNLLALNAAVEAARAGEAGKGFAVVATEVRALAQRSAQAAKDVGMLIKDSETSVEGGVSLVNRTGDAFNAIVGQVAEISRQVGNVAEAATQQASAINQINAAIIDMERLTEENAGFVDRSSEASRSLANQVDELVHRVSRFRTSAA